MCVFSLEFYFKPSVSRMALNVYNYLMKIRFGTSIIPIFTCRTHTNMILTFPISMFFEPIKLDVPSSIGFSATGLKSL